MAEARLSRQALNSEYVFGSNISQRHFRRLLFPRAGLL
jgi:hypothetical protein